MASKIFVNLAVTDLARSTAFFRALGFTFNPAFTDAKATCMIVSDHIFVMLLLNPFFQTFTSKRLCDPHQATEVLVCLEVESRERVDTLVEQALAAGGRATSAAQDHGFMYQHGFEDPDGHLWELVHVTGTPN